MNQHMGRKRRSIASHLPIESNQSLQSGNTAEAAQQQQFHSSIENANVHKALCIVNNTENKKKKKELVHMLLSP